MAELEELSPAKALLLASKFAADSNVSALRALTAQHPDTLRRGLVLRILLTYLPESTDPSLYVPFLQELAGDRPVDDEETVGDLDASSLEHLTEGEARKRVRKLHLLALAPPSTAQPPTLIDDISLFLVHRGHRVDAQAGLLTLLPQLIVSFLDRSEYLRSWFISTVLPLLRLSYEYYPQEGAAFSLAAFERLSGQAGVGILLGRAGGKGHDGDEGNGTIGRDLKGLVGPWMYGHTRDKRRKLEMDGIELIGQSAPEDMSETDEETGNAWNYVFQWMVDTAGTNFPLVLEAIEQWDGPGDVDLGDYDDGQTYLDEDEQARLEKLYAKSAIAAILATGDSSPDTIQGVRRVLVRMAALMDLDIPPDSPTSSPRLPVYCPPSTFLKRIFMSHLSKGKLLQRDNPITNPNEDLLSFLNALVLSASILEKHGHGLPLVRVIELYLFGDENDQKGVLQRLLRNILNGPKRDENAWRRLRLEALWLWGWGVESSTEKNINAQKGAGVLGKVGRDFLEMEILRALLNGSCYDLVMEFYSRAPDSKRPITMAQVEKVVLESAMNYYDNSSNGNKTRGGMKRATDAIATLYTGDISNSLGVSRAEKLIVATHALSFYSLTLQHGVPFQPVNIRVHQDPISLIGKVLEQNPRSYTKLDDLIDIGRNLIEAGLSYRKQDGAVVETSLSGEDSLVRNAEQRITGMAIEAALSEDDFETAYSYVMNRLGPTSPQAVSRSNAKQQHDDTSWRAAFQAGRYRSSKSLTRSRSSATSGPNPEIRRLEMRMELLSQALLLAPAAALSEVLGVWRRCEEELNTIVAQETEAELKWDDKGDNRIPGQFVSSPPPQIMKREGRNSTKSAEEAPMGLFDVARGAAAALSKSAFPLRAPAGAQRSSGHERAVSSASAAGSDSGSIGGSEGEGRVRKRDMVSNMVTGGLASGIGWVLGAKPVQQTPGKE